MSSCTQSGFRYRLGLKNPCIQSSEEVSGILTALQSHSQDDLACDKWLYQAVSRAVETGVARTGAMLLADALKDRLQRRADPWSFTSVALGAGASVNAARLALEDVISAPSIESGEMLAAKGTWGVRAVGALLKVMSTGKSRVTTVSPRVYASTLRTALFKGASTLESAGSELVDVAWTCRRAAVQVLITLAPAEVDVATSEALRGLLNHSKVMPASAFARSTWFASLEDNLKPWRASPFIALQWFMRQAVALEVEGDDLAAARTRCRGRARVGDWPLFHGILYCADSQRKQDPTWVLFEAVRCFRAALDDVPGQYAAAAWRRAWLTLARAPMIFRCSQAQTASCISPAETALLTLADVMTRCEWRSDLEKRNAIDRCVDACWFTATLAARRGAVREVVMRCKYGERLSSRQRSAAGYAATGLVMLRRATSADALHTARALLEYSTLLPHGGIVPWTGLTDCLERMQRGFDAVVAGAHATCHCFHFQASSVHDAVACYSRVVTSMTSGELSSSLMPLHISTELSLAITVMGERLRICEGENSLAAVLSAAEDLVKRDKSTSNLALSRVSVSLVRRGAYNAARALACHCLKAVGDRSDTSAVASCSLALVACLLSTHSDKQSKYQASALSALSSQGGIQQASALSALKGVPLALSDNVDYLVSASTTLWEAFMAKGNVSSEVQTCETLAAVIPTLRNLATVSSTTTAIRSGLLYLKHTRDDLTRFGNQADLCYCATGDVASVEARHYALQTHGKIGGSTSQVYLAIAFDEARAVNKQLRAIAQVALKIFDARACLNDLASTKNALNARDAARKIPQCCYDRHGIFIDDSAQSSVTSKSALWLSLGHFWFKMGCRARALKYVRRIINLRQCPAIASAAKGLELSIASVSKDWSVAATVIEFPSDEHSASFPENMRCFEHVLEEGDVLRRQGNIEGARLCYASASQIIDSLKVGIAMSSLGCLKAHVGKKRHQGFQVVLSRGARLIDLRAHATHALTAHRVALRTQPCITVNGCCLRYRFARSLFEVARGNAAAASEVLELLRHTFLSAWNASQWKLAAKSARALAVAALQFLPGAAYSPLVALLAHSSLGRSCVSVVANSNPANCLSRAIARVDNLLVNFLEVHTAESASWRDRAALDGLLTTFPDTYSIAAALISPTGHLLISRLQRSQSPITLCAALPLGWNDSHNSGSATGVCRHVLMACTAGLCMDRAAPRGDVNHSVDPRDKLMGALQKEASFEGVARKLWWFRRHSLDSALEKALDAFDRTWLGAMRALFATAPTSGLLEKNHAECPRILQLCIYAAPHLTYAETDALLRASAVGVVQERKKESVGKSIGSNMIAHMLRLWLNVVAKLEALQLKAVLSELGLCTSGLKQHMASRLSTVLQKSCIASHCVLDAVKFAMERQPLILALDKQLQFLPIEDLRIPRDASTSRVPSLAFALFLAAGTYLRDAVMPDSTSMRACCVIDPEANLPATRRKMAEYLEAMKNNSSIEWSCTVFGGKLSASDPKLQLTTDMPSCAAFLFCGHGQGTTYLQCVVNSNFMSAVFLMGCSSGALSREGDFEPRGVALEMLARGAPIVVAMLWDVTDRDTDRLTLSLLQSLAENPMRPIPALLNVARGETKLQKLNGAAPVCYGLPVSLAIIEHARCTHAARTA